MQVLCVIGVIHNSHLNRSTLLFCLEIYYVIEKMSTMFVYKTHKLFQTIFGMENLLTCLSCFWVRTKVGKRYLDSSIKICKFTHTVSNNIPFVCCCGEDRRVWPELLTCTILFCFSNNLHWI